MDQLANQSTASDLASRYSSPTNFNEFSRWIIRWLLFFLISLGLGYAAWQRYDPRNTPGLSDAAVYFRMAGGEEVQAREMRFRVLVPWVAKPFYALSKKFLDNTQAIDLALLISNSIFCATTGCLLVMIGMRVTGNLAIALLGVTLYLLNFAVMNLQLAGTVDAGEACLVLAVVVTLSGCRWWLLPIWGLLGALAKETFVPLAGVLALGWWFAESRKAQNRVQRLLPILAMLGVSITTIIVLRSMIAGTMELSDLLAQTHAAPGDASRFTGVLFSSTFWYVFIWLLPLGLLRLNRLPRPWVLASILSALTALALGMYRDVGGNVARPVFDVLGPILSLSAAIFLTGLSKQPAPNDNDV